MNSRLSLLALTLVFSSAAWAQPEPDAAPAPTPPASSTAPDGAPGAQRGERRARGNPEDFRARIMSNLREQMDVPKDDEWAIISERITALNEVRRSTGPGMGGAAFMAMRGAGGGAGGGGQGAGRDRRMGPQASPEVEALQTAIKDKAPDAEVQSRLAKLREVRKENEAKLAKAQEDLRSVLNVRQEAVAVMNGLLP